jgi:hypothetical protein
LHRSGLAALLLLAVLLAGCGGGGADESPSSSTQGTASEVSSTASEAQLPEEVQEKLKRAEAKVKEERARADKSPASQPPQVEHHDSGGGSAQFRTKGGDNSIVEYGTEASDSEREDAATSLHAYLDSLAAHRWDAACTYMSAGLAAGMEQFAARFSEKEGLDSCPEILAALNANASQAALDAAAQVDVASLRVAGDRAMVLYRGAEGQGYAMPMVREEGVWRVSAPAGTPAL